MPKDGTAHFSLGLGSNRYDFWRVGLGELQRHPLNGIGTDNFAIDYLARRKSIEEPVYPHSLEIRVLAQTGVVGALLLGAFLVFALLAGARGRRSADSDAAAAAPLALMLAVQWLVHGSVDWFWEFPALSAMALFGLAVAARLGGSVGGLATTRSRHRAPGAGLALVGALLGIALLASFALP
jgi:O-antigen ligase